MSPTSSPLPSHDSPALLVLRAALASVPVAIYTTDLDGRITFYNRAAAALWGRDPQIGAEYWCGSHRILSSSGEDIAIDSCFMAISVRERRDVPPIEVIIERPDGTRRYVQASPQLLRDETGAIVGGVNTLVDITPQKDAARLSARLAAIVESSDDAIVSKTLDGVITSWNKGAERIFGYTSDEAVGRPIVFLLPEDRRNEEDLILARLRNGERVDHFETVRVTKDGRLLNVSLTISPVRDANGTIIGASKIARDITQQKQAQIALERLNADLEAKVAERTAIAEQRAKQLRLLASELIRTEQRERKRIAGAIHDNLMQGLAISNMRLSMIDAPLPSEAAQVLSDVSRNIADSIQSARALLQDLVPPLLTELGLISALEHLGGRLKRQYGLNIDLMVDGDDSGIDEELLTFAFQATREALVNAIKHGKVDEATVRVERQDQHLLTISVIDHGLGFSAGAIDEKELRAEHFGLMSIQERSQVLGGKMSIASQPGVGTTWKLELPIRVRTRREVDQRSSHTAGGRIARNGHRVIRVLLADDHAVMREGLAKLLGLHEQIQIVGQAADGQEAVDLARRLMPDVVIMDVTMPRLSGLEATRVITSEMHGVRVIGLSMHDDAMAASMLAVGAAAYLSKDGPADQLLRTIMEQGQAAGVVPARNALSE